MTSRLTLFSLLAAFAITTSASAQQTKARTIKLGAIAPLSGDFAYQGYFIKNGIELALEELKAEGISVAITYEDACLPKETILAAQKLVRQKIDALVGSYCIIGMVPAASIFEQNKILSFQTSVVPDKLLTKSDWILTTNTAIADEARALARLARSELGAIKAGIIYFPSDWGNDYSKHFSEEFQKLGGQIAGSQIAQLNQMDFRAELTHFKSRGIDLLFVPHISSALGVIATQARKLGLTANLISTNEAEDPHFFKAAGSNADGMIVLTTGHQADERFAQKYKERYDDTPAATAANAYDATKLAVSAMISCSFDHECAKRKVYSTSSYKGASGTFSIEPDGRTHKAFLKKIARNGAFIAADELAEAPLAQLKRKER